MTLEELRKLVDSIHWGKGPGAEDMPISVVLRKLIAVAEAAETLLYMRNPYEALSRTYVHNSDEFTWDEPETAALAAALDALEAT